MTLTMQKEERLNKGCVLNRFLSLKEREELYYD